jgi:hypothetical protein
MALDPAGFQQAMDPEAVEAGLLDDDDPWGRPEAPLGLRPQPREPAQRGSRRTSSR